MFPEPVAARIAPFFSGWGGWWRCCRRNGWWWGGCVAFRNSRPLTNACKNTGFAFNSTGGERGATQVSPLICHIIMPDMDEAANFA